MTRQQQQLYVNVWQTSPFKIKQCTETVAYHYSLHMLQWSTAVDAVCTKKPNGVQLHLIMTGLLNIKYCGAYTKTMACSTRDNTNYKGIKS